MCGRIHQWSHQVLSFSWLGGFWLLIQSPYSLLICSDFYFFTIQSGKMYVSRNFSLSSMLFSLLVFKIVSSEFFYFCGISCNVSSFISNFTWVFFFPYSLNYQLCFSFKRLLFSIILYCFSILYSIYFCLSLYHFLLSTNFGISSFLLAPRDVK